jgi:hypothetical protein
MQNLDEVGRFVHPIVDQDGSMHELEDTGKSVQRAADVREVFSQPHVVKDCIAETLGRG